MERTRIAIVADSHYCRQSRFDECIRVHNWIADDAAARGCGYWLHAGDVYERLSTPIERVAVADWTQLMTDRVGDGVIVRGNHDAVGDLPLLERLETWGRSVHVVEDARVIGLEGIMVACMGWPQRSNVHAMLGADVVRELAEMAAQDALRSVLRGLGDQLRASPEHLPRIFLGHMMVRGSRVSTGQPLVGCDFEIGLDDLSLVGASFYGLGHIHLGQEWDVGGAPAVYPSSPRRTSFGEMEDKGYLVVEFDGPRLIGWDRITTPCTPMVHVEAQWCGEHVGLPGDVVVPAGLATHGGHERTLEGCRGAEVRLRYMVPSDQREAARAAAHELRDKMLAAGAIHVKVEEEVQAEQRARAPEVARAITLDDKLRALWASKGFEPGDREPELLGKVHQLEGESHAVAL